MRTIILLFLLILYAPTGCSFRRVGSKWLVPKASSLRTFAVDAPIAERAQGGKTLLSLPKSSFKLNEIVSAIHKWGVAQAETGSAISSLASEQGVEFSIEPQRAAFLAVSAVEVGSLIQIQVTENLADAETRLLPLLRLASGNLIDSICSDLGMMAMTNQHNQRDESRDGDAASGFVGRVQGAVSEEIEVFDEPKNIVCIDVHSGEVEPMGAVQGFGSVGAVASRDARALAVLAAEKADVAAAGQTHREGTSSKQHRPETVAAAPSLSAAKAPPQMQMRPAAVTAVATGIHTDDDEGSTDSTDDISTAQFPSTTSFTPGPVEISMQPPSGAAQSTPVVFDIPEDDSQSVRQALQQAEFASRSLSSSPVPSTQTSPPDISGQVTGRRGHMDTAGDQYWGKSVPHKPTPFKRRDPETMHKATQLGLNLERFEEKGIEDQALQELNAMLRNSRSEGFLSVIRSYAVNSTALEAENLSATTGTASLTGLFESGKQQSALSLEEILNRPTLGESTAQLRQPTPQLPMYLPERKDGPAGERLDIFQSPNELYGQVGADLPGAGQRSADYIDVEGSPMKTREDGFSYNPDPQAPPDPKNFPLDQQRLYVLLTELNRTAAELQDGVIDSYRDLLLSENMLFLLKRANTSTVDYNQRLFYQKITEKTITLTAELGALVKTESMRHLQTIQDICEIAADYQQDEEKFLTRMQYMKPRFDTAFLAYLNYAMGEETTRMRQAGVDPTAAPSEWLKVLLIVKQGVVAEFEARYRQLLEPLLLVARFDAGPLRSDIFRRFVAITPAMELPYLKALALNMIEGILAQDDGTTPGLAHPSTNNPTGASAQGVFAYSSAQRSDTPLPDPRLVPRMLTLRADVDTHLSDDVIRDRIATFRAEVRAQGQDIVVRHRNPVMQDELETARELAQQQQVRGGLNLPGLE